MSLTDALIDPATGDIATPAHELSAGLLLWARGKTTKQQVMDRVPVPEHARADLGALASVFNARTGADQALYVLEVEAASILLQNGNITPAEFRSLVEI